MKHCTHCKTPAACKAHEECLKPPAKEPADSGSDAPTCCASFDGSETFEIGMHRKREERQAVGQNEWGQPTEYIWLWTDHVIEFDSRERPFKRGDIVKVGDVEMFVTGYRGRWIIAEGREMRFRHNAEVRHGAKDADLD